MFSSFVAALHQIKFNNSIVLPLFFYLNKKSENGKLADNGNELYNVASSSV